MEEHVEHQAEVHDISAETAEALGAPAHPPEELHATVAAPHGGDAHDAHAAAGPMDVSGEMFIWTLGTFAVMAFILGKFAWKPILAGLDQREQDIRQSVDNAEKVRAELSAIDGQRREIIGQADAQAKDIVSRARRAGVESERAFEEKAREEAAILMENAEREIRSVREKAAADLRKDSVDAAIALAGKLIGENLDDQKNRQLTDRLINEL
jgi:F-type H+-transporting ATPase subunit b